MKVKLKDRTLNINAPREMVFQMLAAFGKGAVGKSDRQDANSESSRILERQGDVITAEFRTRSGRRVYRTVEAVRLDPPRRVGFRHLDGPLSSSEEEFMLSEEDQGTRLQYQGWFEYKVRWLPGMGWLIAVLLIKGKYDGVIRDHMERLKATAEARAARSHAFPQPAER